MKKEWTFKKHVLLSVSIILTITLVELMINSMSMETKMAIITKLMELLRAPEKGSIGIIGGADGPTTAFIACQTWTFMILPKLILLGLMLVTYKPVKKAMTKNLRTE